MYINAQLRWWGLFWHYSDKFWKYIKTYKVEGKSRLTSLAESSFSECPSSCYYISIVAVLAAAVSILLCFSSLIRCVSYWGEDSLRALCSCHHRYCRLDWCSLPTKTTTDNILWNGDCVRCPHSLGHTGKLRNLPRHGNVCGSLNTTQAFSTGFIWAWGGESRFTSSLVIWVGSGGSCLEALTGRRGFLGGRWGRLRQLSGKEKQKQKEDIRICMKFGAICVLWPWLNSGEEAEWTNFSRKRHECKGEAVGKKHMKRNQSSCDLWFDHLQN